jgi:hypothetical protein
MGQERVLARRLLQDARWVTVNNGAGKPIVALDIDGTLGDYHRHFLTFAQNWLGQKMPAPDQINPGQPLWRFMGVDKGTYKECKLAYRQGGLKRWMPAYPYADELTAAIRAIGAEVWICTTRPYLRLDNIDPDTREWLRRNHIVWDAVLFDLADLKYSKYRELARQGGRRVACIVDDLPEAINAIPAENMDRLQHVIIRDQPYNRHFSFDPGHPMGLLGDRRFAGTHMLDLWPLISDAVASWQMMEGLATDG